MLKYALMALFALMVLTVLIIGSVVLLGDKSQESKSSENVVTIEKMKNNNNKISNLDGLFKSQHFNENYARLVDSIVWDSEENKNNLEESEIVCQNKGQLSIDQETDNIVCKCKNGYSKLEKQILA